MRLNLESPWKAKSSWDYNSTIYLKAQNQRAIHYHVNSLRKTKVRAVLHSATETKQNATQLATQRTVTKPLQTLSLHLYSHQLLSSQQIQMKFFESH